MFLKSFLPLLCEKRCRPTGGMEIENFKSSGKIVGAGSRPATKVTD